MLILGLLCAVALYVWQFQRVGLFGASGSSACQAQISTQPILPNLLNFNTEQLDVGIWQIIRRVFGEGERGAARAATLVALSTTIVTSLTTFYLFGSLAGGAAALLMMLYLVSRRLEAFTYPRELFLLPLLALLFVLSAVSVEPGATRLALDLSPGQASWVAMAQAMAAGLLAALVVIWLRRSLLLVALLGVAMAFGPSSIGRVSAYAAGLALMLGAAALTCCRLRDVPAAVLNLLRRRLAELMPTPRPTPRIEQAQSAVPRNGSIAAGVGAAGVGSNGAAPLQTRPPELMNVQVTWWEPLLWSTLLVAVASATGLLLTAYQIFGGAFSVVAGPLAGTHSASVAMMAAFVGSWFLVSPRARRPAQLLLILPSATVFAGLAVRGWGVRAAEVVAEALGGDGGAGLSIFDSLTLVIVAGAILALALAELRLWLLRDAGQLATVLWESPQTQPHSSPQARSFERQDARIVELHHRKALDAYLRQRCYPDEAVLVQGISAFSVLRAGRKLVGMIGNEFPAETPAVIIAPPDAACHRQVTAMTGLPYRLDMSLDGLEIYRLSTRSRETASALKSAAAAEAAGRSSEAKAAYEQARRSDPWCAEARLGLARCFFQLGSFDDCCEALAMAVELAPASPLAAEALYLKGLAFVNLGRQGEGRETLQQALALLPVQSDILAALGQLEREAGDLAAAAERYECIADIRNLPTEQRLQASLTAAKCHLEAGQWQQARRATESWGFERAAEGAANGHNPLLEGIRQECRRMLTAK